MPSSCSYNCSRPLWSANDYYNNDITGVGVVINYIATAGIAVFITVVYYVFVYQPSQGPFGKTDGNTLACIPNPVDELFLGWLRHWSGCLLKSVRPFWVKPQISNRLEKKFIQCFLAMSDLQLLTGLSILVSGASQLRCGVTTMYWGFIMDLAWLSCFTHLVCLTLLRRYLYNRPSERLWRLIFMGALVLFVAVGLFCQLSFYSDYDYDASRAAICYFGQPLRMPPHQYDAGAALVSALVIILGFGSRVVKLHRAFSAKVFDRPRSWLSLQARNCLKVILDKCCKGHRTQSLRRSLCYRPLLAAFLTIRFVLDTLTSLLFEVAWLGATFAWGTSKVVWTFFNLFEPTKDLETGTAGTPRNILLQSPTTMGGQPLVTIQVSLRPQSHEMHYMLAPSQRTMVLTISKTRLRIGNAVQAHFEQSLLIHSSLAFV
ncbi:hypothetical protein N7494_004341 [Penicillium frequentans]|uniref:Uncharacterized protein n=1 Tax=Penicillium frequentans TaxID=3151616 RepID=A0AAD6D0G0_9EURO|nr:hypothetical protein N7494_004341 [Penicillium glabrum]